jgi:hypothetical protein
MRMGPAVLLALLLAGCNFIAPTLPGNAPDVEGTVISLLPDQRALVEVHRSGS